LKREQKMALELTAELGWVHCEKKPFENPGKPEILEIN
jgi:hypothetical protein